MFYEINIPAAKDAAEARKRIARVTFALSTAHGKTLREIIIASDVDARERAQRDAQELMGAMAELTAIELYLYNQEREGK
jgi:hypothetical protein